MRRIIKRTVTTVTTVTTTITWSDEAPAAEAQPAADSGSISARPACQRPAAEEDSTQAASDAP